MENCAIKKFYFFIVFMLFEIMFIYICCFNTVEAEENLRGNYSISDIKEMIEEDNLMEVYSEDGSIEICDVDVQRNVNKDKQDNSSITRTVFDEVKIVDSGKPDNESIVMTIMGDGFTSSEQNAFINAATNAVNYLIGNASLGLLGFYPFNLFRDYFTVYAIKVISEESGVSRDADTNNGHIVNNYFGSSFYYGNDTSTTQRGLVITKKLKANVLKKPNSLMNVIICNSSRWGGTGDDFAVISMHSNCGQILTHELGHTLGELADEYWYSGEPFDDEEKVNKTINGDIYTNKWKHWIGQSGIYSGIGIFRYSSNPSDIAYNWFKPHENCQMQYSNSPFCAVCSEALIKKLEQVTGSFFDTTTLSSNQIRIDKVNYDLYGSYEIPPLIDEKQVVAIYQNAFQSQSYLDSIVIPSTITSIGNNAFQLCTDLETVTFASGSNLTTIGSNAFSYCNSLESIVIPSGVTSIGANAFNNCMSLEEVEILNDTLPLTAIGPGTFDNCNPHLEITVPTNRLCDYKLMTNWSSYASKIVPKTTLPIINLDCEMESSNRNLFIYSNHNKLYELNVECGKSYKFIGNSFNDVTLTIYKSDLSLVGTDENTLISYLGVGTYYLDLRFTSVNDYGNLTLNYSLTYPNINQLTYGSNNILTKVHSISNNMRHGYFYYNHTLEEGFYKFSVTTTSINNVTYPVNTIQIFTDCDKTTLLNRYPITNSVTAHSMTNENTLYVYIPQSGTYYIDVLLNSYNYSSLVFTISELDNNTYDLSNNLISPIFSELFTSNKYSCFEEINISHRSSWNLSIVTYGYISTNIEVYVFKKELDMGYDIGDEHYICSLYSSYNITSNDSSPVIPIIFNPGAYYIGYSFNINNVNVSFALTRIINQNVNMTSTLVTDPSYNGGFTLGSEVLFNNGDLLGNTITEGFTRCIYLMVEDRLLEPMSRLDYDWYSSNYDVASVTQYGTVLAYPVESDTNVTIYAVLKADPSVIYYKTFTVLDDTDTDEIDIECNMSYSYSEENGTYQLELNSSNCPFPMITYYMWDIIVPSINPNLEVEIDDYGYLTSNGTGTVMVLGNYYLNPRVFIVIYLTINS